MSTIRIAQPTDVPAMKAIAEQTWDGNDYLPLVLDQWLADPKGQFYVAQDVTQENQIVGYARLTALGEREWWLESIRVAPERYGQGIGRLLHHYCVDQAERQAQTEGQGLLRFTTGSTNKAIQTFAAETNFTLSGAYMLYRADSTPLHGDEFRTLTAQDIPTVRNFLERSAYHQVAERSMEGDSYKWFLLTDERLWERTDQLQLYGWYPQDRLHDKRRGKLSGIVIVNPSLPPQPGKIAMLHFAYLDAAVGELAVMCAAVRGLAGSLGFRKVQHRFLTLPERLVAIEQAGFRSRSADQIYLYTKTIG